MALTHVDLDGGGSATAPYDTWAKAASDVQTGLTAALAGGTCFVQGAAADTASGSRTLTSAGTVTNPTKIIGVKDGTTNEGTSIVASDLAVRGTDTLPQYSNSTSGNILFAGAAHCFGCHFTSVGWMYVSGAAHSWVFSGCKNTFSAILYVTSGRFDFIDCELEFAATASEILVVTSAGSGNLFVRGGVSTFTAAATKFLRAGSYGEINFSGHDLSGYTGSSLVTMSANNTRKIRFKNCKIPTSLTRLSANFTSITGNLEMISCNNDTSIANTSSLQEYTYDDTYGTVENEATVVRTGGADDGASGLFSYAMTTNTDAVVEGAISLASPWMTVWVSGGASKTATVYIANSTASTDYNEDEAWCEFYTPDAGDTAQHDQTFDPALTRLLDSATAVTDDTGSTWGTGGLNHQKFSVTTTPGFEGWVYARVHLAKRQATPDTLYLDPKISVT